MKIICVGLNYKTHAIEMGRDFPAEPLVFLKPDSAILLKNKPFFIPDFSEDIQYEAELVFRICRLGKSIQPRFASRYYDAVTVGIDITARDIQNRQSKAGLPWDLSKTFDGSAPVGTFIPLEEAMESGEIAFSLDINGSRVQTGSSADMIFSIDSIISYVSKYYTLKTGDMIFTGTPSGVGPIRKNDNLVARIGSKKVLDFKAK